jgi:polysaccharide pyruvyl transferase WcaK-like protein
MSRLAHGGRADIGKKDMLKLTNKNYENLPEVKRKREEEKKREEAKKRLETVKNLEKSRRSNMGTRKK